MVVLLSVVALIIGAALLYYGAEFLVGGASTLARVLGVPAVVVGLTVVSYGTSLPEFSVTVLSALRQSTDLALGNVIGSNITNIALILGVAALIRPVVFDRSLLRRELPLLLFVSVLLVVMSVDGEIGHIDGALLSTFGFGYTVYSIRSSRRRSGAAEAGPSGPAVSRVRQVALILGGLVLLGLGAQAFVYGASELASLMGVSDRVIGLTVVALGTSLPELAASGMASLRGEDDISVGNVVGSCYFNIAFVLGVAALMQPIPNSLDLGVVADLGLMVLLSAALLPMAMGRGRVGRIKGGLLVSTYALYTVYLFAMR